jgi:hypothetical protein
MIPLSAVFIKERNRIMADWLNKGGIKDDDHICIGGEKRRSTQGGSCRDNYLLATCIPEVPIYHIHGLGPLVREFKPLGMAAAWFGQKLIDAYSRRLCVGGEGQWGKDREGGYYCHNGRNNDQSPLCTLWDASYPQESPFLFVF